MNKEIKSGLLIIFIAISMAIMCSFILYKVIKGGSIKLNADKRNNEYFDLVVIYEDSNSTKIAYDKNTGVMYYIKSNFYVYGITPIYNADGSLKLYEGENDG